MILAKEGLSGSKRALSFAEEASMHTVLLGGTGFIGSALSRYLSERGDTVLVTTRSKKGRTGTKNIDHGVWDGRTASELAPLLQGAEAIINLLGASIGSGRWTQQQKEHILQSRVQSGKALVEALQQVSDLPKVVIQASAVGYYGFWNNSATAPSCLESSPSGTGFLAQTCMAWENSTQEIETWGVRRCVIRTAPVLGPGGMLAGMLSPYRLGMGGIPGNGRQPFPWIHLEDETRAIVFLLDTEALIGPVNLTAPATDTMKDFVLALGKTLHRPVWVPLPALALRLFLGQMAEELLLGGQKAVPQKLVDAGFSFHFSSLSLALDRSIPPLLTA